VKTATVTSGVGKQRRAGKQSAEINVHASEILENDDVEIISQGITKTKILALSRIYRRDPG